MNAGISGLLSHAGDSIRPSAGFVEVAHALADWGELGKELALLLSKRNGFYAFESALLIRPLQDEGPPRGLIEWNAPDLWRSEYASDIDRLLFFAEDVFGSQFCLGASGVCTFDPETGLVVPFVSSISEWAEALIAESNVLTGYSLAHAWQVQHGPLHMGQRLLPKVPFVVGGKYQVDNLYALDEAVGMSFRASIANQIRNVPDGAKINLKIAPPLT